MGNYVFDYVEVEIDEPVLKEIAEITQGQYFRATDKNSLESVYQEIDKLEKDKISTIEYQVEIPERFFKLRKHAARAARGPTAREHDLGPGNRGPDWD